MALKAFNCGDYRGTLKIHLDHLVARKNSKTSLKFLSRTHKRTAGKQLEKPLKLAFEKLQK